MSEEEVLNLFREILEEAGKRFQKHPMLISRREYEQCSSDRLSKSRIEKTFGSFGAAKELAFPPEPGPFESKEHFHAMEVDEARGIIVDCIAHARDAYCEPPHEITWDQFRRHINLRYGVNDAGIIKYAITKLGGYNRIRDGHFRVKPTPVTVAKVRLSEHAKLSRRLGVGESQIKFMLDDLFAGVKEIFSRRRIVTKCSHPVSSNAPIKRILTLMLSDLHIGANIDGRDTGYLSFNRVEESRRLAKVCQEVIDFNEDRSNTELRILLLGDIIQGDLKHDPRDGAILSEQGMRAIYLLTQVITFLASHFPKVTVDVTAGNHGRFISRHPGRAINQKYDSLEHIIYYALSVACPNVQFRAPRPPYIVQDLFGKKALFTHGDTFLNAGNAQKVVHLSKIEEQINRINNTLKDTDEYRVVGIGHLHASVQTFLNNGCTLLINSSLCPLDPYALSLGIVESRQGQWLFESTERRPFGKTYFIEVGGVDDRNADLDQIIKPFQDDFLHDI